MRSLTRFAHHVRTWGGASTAVLALLVGSPAHARSKVEAIGECVGEIAGITLADEAANATASAAEQAADIGFPVMDKGIMLGINQINANLASLEGPLTSIAKSTCGTDNTLSNSASTSAFLGWTDVLDAEPDPLTLGLQMDGTAEPALPQSRAASIENKAAIAKMLLNVKDGYIVPHLDNEANGLASMEGMGMAAITNEKAAFLASKDDLLRLKKADNITDLTAMQAIIIRQLYLATVRNNMMQAHQAIQQAQLEFNRTYATNKLYYEDKMATVKMMQLN